MNLNVNTRRLLYALSFSSLAVVTASAFAQTSSSALQASTEVKPGERRTSEVKSGKLDEKKSVEAKAPRFDADLDNDGIIDAVQSLVSLQSFAATNAKQSSDSILQKDLTAGFSKAHQVVHQTKRNSCFDYMMLSPEEKDRVNQRVQSRTLGAFGTKPCDPFVSPLLERPYDNNYVELPLLPRASVVVRD